MNKRSEVESKICTFILIRRKGKRGEVGRVETLKSERERWSSYCIRNKIQYKDEKRNRIDQKKEERKRTKS